MSTGAGVAEVKAVEGLHPELQAKLAEYRKKRAFNAKDWIAKKVDLFLQYLQKSSLKGAVLNLSGGVDSAVTLGLLRRAQDAPNSPLKRILAIAQPIHSSAWAQERAVECAKAMNAPIVVVDQTEIHDKLAAMVDSAVGVNGNHFVRGQLRSYQRTPVCYYVAQLLTQDGFPAVVMGTGNQDEDGYLAYFCKAGDGVVDIQLIADLHKSEVFAVGAELGVPKSILVAPPSADLWPGQTDEGELGFGYDFVELFTGAYVNLPEAQQAAFLASLGSEARAQFQRLGDAARTIHRRNAHKFDAPHNINIMENKAAWS